MRNTFNSVMSAACFLVFSAVPAFAQAPAPLDKAPDLTKTPTVYEIGYSHLDTEWCWLYPQVIDEFIPNTLHQNFALLDKYPDYIFNWTGANRYKFMKEYYPADYARLKTYIAAGRWVTGGSSLEEGDVDIPSEESIIRNVLYSNEFFKSEFGNRLYRFHASRLLRISSVVAVDIESLRDSGFLDTKANMGISSRHSI